MRPVTKVYVASPLGFADAGRFYYRDVLLPALRTKGFEPLDPWAMGHMFTDALVDTEPGQQLAILQKVNATIGARNESLIATSKALLAILDGSDVDSGTAAEIGWAAALKIPIVGLRSDLRSSGDNQATPINLQVAYFIQRSGGRIVSSLNSAVEMLHEITESSASTDQARTQP